jgi:hypothetical protein
VDSEIAREMRERVHISNEILKVQTRHIENHKLQEKAKRCCLSLSLSKSVSSFL